MQDCDRLQYDGVVFEKDYVGPAYNLWSGYGVDPAEGDVSLFLDYINNVLACRDMELGRWIIHWLAHAVQNPTRPSVPTALTLCGPQGQGKSHLLRLMRSIMPNNVIEIADAKNRFLSKFNRELIGQIFVGAEEAIFSGDPRLAQILKTFISSEVWQYEAKYGATISLPNVHRLIATTNQLHASQIDADDRRMTIVHVPKTHDLSTAEGKAASRAYWGPQFVFLKTGAPALLHYLLTIEVDGLGGTPCPASLPYGSGSNPAFAVYGGAAVRNSDPQVGSCGFCTDGPAAAGFQTRSQNHSAEWPRSCAVTIPATDARQPVCDFWRSGRAAPDWFAKNLGTYSHDCRTG